MKWTNSGLNIFLSVKVCDLPPDLFAFTPEQMKKTLCLVGHGGKSLWEKLPHPLDKGLHPLDHYTIDQIELYAKNFLKDDCEILFPNDAYTLPLQRIGRFLNLCAQSPIGLDISDEFGLWFAFRGVFLTSETIVTDKIDLPPSLCMKCIERPCLSTLDIGLARLRCPVKTECQYGKEQIEFHQAALNILKV
jgi:hypothetical protein